MADYNCWAEGIDDVFVIWVEEETIVYRAYMINGGVTWESDYCFYVDFFVHLDGWVVIFSYFL